MKAPAEYHLSPPATPTPKELAAALVDNIETELDGCDGSRLVWAEVEATFAHLLTKHASDCAWLISQIQIRDKELAKAERDELKDLVGMQAAKIADLYKRNAILADDNTSFDKENTALRERLAAALAAATETSHELSYERQMRQQTEEAMIKLAARVKEEQAAAAEAEREKLVAYEALRKVRDEIKWMAGALEIRRPDDFTTITAGQLAGKVRADLLALLTNETSSAPGLCN